MFHEGLTGSSEEPEGKTMTKTEIIAKLQEQGVNKATSTLKRVKTEDLLKMLDSIDAGKTGDVTDHDTDCGGCENGECDNCGAYECCAETDDFSMDRVADAIERSQGKFTGESAADLLSFLGVEYTKNWEDKKVYKRASFTLDGGKWSAYAYGDKKVKLNPTGKADEKKARLEALETVLVEAGVRVSWTTGTDRPHAMVTFE